MRIIGDQAVVSFAQYAQEQGFDLAEPQLELAAARIGGVEHPMQDVQGAATTLSLLEEWKEAS